MVITTKRRFSDESNREATSLWKTSGRMRTDGGRVGIMPTMLRRWQRRLEEGSAPQASPAAKPLSMIASPADQSSEMRGGIASLAGADGARYINKNAVGIFGEMPW